jgi:hypothetical protein
MGAMREVTEEAAAEPETAGAPLVDLDDAAPRATQFTDAGVLPQVAPLAAASAGPTASERAYDDGAALHALHKPASPQHADPATSSAAPAPVDPDIAKRIGPRGMAAAWDQLAVATADERSTPQYVRLPANIVKELDRAWQDSLAGKEEREQGGNLVRNMGGSYEIRRGANEDKHMFDQDDSDVGWTQKLVAQVHTHPYRDEKEQVPEQFATFSEGDFDSLMRSDAHMSVLRSGPYTFMLSKTKQFEAMVEATNNDENKLSALAQRMTDVYDNAFDATEGSFSEKTEAGVLAVCQRFHLVYYSGQGSDLSRKTARAPA